VGLPSTHCAAFYTEKHTDILAISAGTANKILEDKEKERSKDDKGKGKEKEHSRKKSKRYVSRLYLQIHR